ncbi:alcohol dehydrogenase catalytic domain-containing protein [Streptomyces lunaelactis]|uniref:alcohol dehydrogenase catalytic domain-containing protein n=1 Tax=Streptomyces lunaelactis TaxID=1535768 RepID=UPI001C2F6B52|nr:alcohol dehydrogenase catalytic domain-containing protein [Streptomyces lunaelactis]
MKALVATGYMPLDQIAIAEVPTPAPGPGQVLIKVEAAALNPLDLALITGAVKDMYSADHPLVVGMDAAGTVAGVGEGVSGYAQGDPVLAFTGQAGAVAEYTVASPVPCWPGVPRAWTVCTQPAFPNPVSPRSACCAPSDSRRARACWWSGRPAGSDCTRSSWPTRSGAG